MELVLIVLGVAGILLGLYGVVMPVLPGLLLVWLSTAGTLLLHRADLVGWLLAAVLTGLFVLGSVVTLWLPTRTGRQGGAPPRTFAYAGVGGVVGFFVLPVLGFVIGALLGLLLGERQRLGAWPPARTSTVRVLKAYGVGVVVEFAVGTTMAITWFVAVLVR